MTQYLILHKVRGEPSFDCAEKMEVNGETWWITNSGHRAYPITAHNLDFIVEKCEMGVANIPKDWPDHFEVRGEKVQPKIDIGQMLSKLLPPIRRRI